MKAFITMVSSMNKSDWFETYIEPYLVRQNSVLLFPLLLAGLAKNPLALLICPVCFFVATWWLKEKRLGNTSRVPLIINGEGK